MTTTARNGRPRKASRPAVAPPCILCGRSAALLGVFAPHDQPGRLLAYGLCGAHPINQSTVDRVDERIGRHLDAERN